MNLIASIPAILMNTLTVVNLIFIMQLLFGLELCKKWQYYPAVAALYAVINGGIVLVFNQEAWLQTFVVYIYILLIVLLLSKGHYIRSMLYTVPAILLYIQWAEVLEMFDRLLGLNRFAVPAGGGSFTPLNLLADVILIIPLTAWIVYVYRTGKRPLLNAAESVVLSLFCLCFPFLEEYLILLDETFHDTVFSVLWVAFVIVMNMALFYGMVHRGLARYYRETVENYREQFRSEYDYFKNYKEEQKATANFRHDWNNHVLLLGGMLESGEYDKATEYLHSLTTEQLTPKKRILTGNEIVDILLDAKREVLDRERIMVTCNGGLERLSFMEDVDICILFSNLIDNAVEANLKCEKERFLSIQVSCSPGVLLIVVSNRMKGELRTRDGRLISTKSADGNHGIGTQNIISVIKKYGGSHTIRTEGNVFRMEISFFDKE